MTDEVLTPFDNWKSWAADGWSVLPYLVRMKEKGSLPASWSGAWESSASPYAVVLESAKGGRYTYLGVDPVSVLSGKDHVATLTNLQSGRTEVLEGLPLEILESWMAPYCSPKLGIDGVPPFIGGCIGFLGYDIVRSLERIPSIAQDDPGFPDYLWMRMEEVWIYDHVDQVTYCAIHCPLIADAHDIRELYTEAEKRAIEMKRLWNSYTESGSSKNDTLQSERNRRMQKLAQVDELELVPSINANTRGSWPGMTADFSQEDFEEAVVRIQEYIRQGDVFQVNLSLRQEKELQSSPEQIYEWLRLLNPSPYMGLLRSPTFSLVSGSPELLVKLDDDQVSARPIAGTRRRGTTETEDALMAEELSMNEKERAEHIMLVDLERNDIGRIAAYGSVHVPELMTIEYYSHVMHLVSQVEGKLAEGKQLYDVIAALFPGGTITGAPKIRTMEIIEELEPVRRGPYTGSMGWIEYNGNMELNIIIRTIAVMNGKGYIQAGAGIVVDSDPYREYRECHNKAKAMVRAVLCSEEESKEEAREMFL
ncbi:para-aminobenzoate synthetase component 1 [Paenibacillus sp. DS2015]|uniref:anthranilate synthase component I family protein n=1 Tax=Paenibacillus sp. DS2015 TaxID=3373917 RepID=UPI003D21D156